MSGGVMKMHLFKNRRFPVFLFICYAAVMLWLLFIRHRDVEIVDYWAQAAARVNLVPFSSMGSMLSTLRDNPRWDVLWVVVYNLGGNIVMFVPLGFLLPQVFPKLGRFWRCMGAVAGIMTCVELAQLFSLRGFCETDDVILNVLGASLGFGFWKVLHK